jgi:hypothetical protein
MAIVRLGDITVIQLGLILERKKADDVSLHVYKRLTLRAMESDGINPEAIEAFYSAVPLQAEYLTKAGTIVMKLFAPFNPIVITEETEGYLFPSQMVCIRPIKSILPEYLCLYLSQDFVAERLLGNYFWIAQRAITVDSLLNLKVRIPSLKNQQIICDYNRNYHCLCRLRKELDKEEQTMMKYIFSILSEDQGDNYDHQKRH